MSELDDVQTTVGAIDGLRARIAELEAENERLKFQSYNELRHRAEIAEVGWESERTAYAELSTLYEHTRGQSEQAEAKLAEVTEDRNGFREAFNKCIERAEDAEDEVKELVKRLEAVRANSKQEYQRANKAEATIERLKTQSCVTCLVLPTCEIYECVWKLKRAKGFSCNRWAERGGE